MYIWILKKTFVLLFLCLFPFGLFAQSAIVEYVSSAQPDGQFMVCGVSETNTLKITNNNSASMVNTKATLHLPQGGTYVVGSIVGASEVDISNLNAPVLSIADIPASNSLHISYKIQFGCALITYQSGGGLTRETVDFSYTLNGEVKNQTQAAPPSTYNIISASLSIINLSPTSYTGNVGNTFNQTITVRNGGLGCINNAFIKLDNALGSFSFSNPSIGIISHDTLYLASAQMPSGDSKWCNSEDLTISYTVKIENCTNLNRSTTVNWGCNNSSCQNSTAANTNVIIANNTPNLSIFIKNPNYDYCFKGESVKQTLKIINTGAGPATNIQISLGTQQPGSFSTLNTFDTLSTWVIRDKNNVIIGNVRNFSNFSSSGGIRNTSCVSYTGITTITGNLQDLTLLSGDSLFVDVYLKANNYACNVFDCSSSIAWLGLRTRLDYKNQCGQGSYNLPYTLLISRARAAMIGNLFVPTDVYGSAPNNTFDLKVDFSTLNTLGHPNGRGKAILFIPLLGTDFQPNGNTAQLGTITLPMNVKNDTLFIGPLNTNTTYDGKSLVVPMKAICGVGGVQNLSISTFIQYDSLCSPKVKFGCISSNINVHCPNPCSLGGATPVKFSLNRISYGLPDNDNNGVPDMSGVIDLSKINDHNSVNGDTLQGTWNVKIYPNIEPTDVNMGKPFKYTYIDFELGTAGIGQPGTLNALPNTQITIFPVGGGASITCYVTPTIQGTKAHYDLSTCKTLWNHNDSLVIKALFTTNQTNHHRFNGSTGSSYSMFVTNNQVYSTYVPQVIPTTAPMAGLTYTCNKWNDYNQISRIWLSPYIPQGQLITGCDNTLYSYMRYYTRTQEGGLIFPYEYRNFWIADIMKVLIPTGFVYRSSSATFENLPILDANVTQVGDTLFFAKLRNFYTKYGGTIVGGDETENRTIKFSLDATCGATNGTYIGGTQTFGLGNGLNTPNADYGKLGPAFYGGAGYTVYTYRAPQPVLAGGGTQTSNSGLATWSLQLQNLANNAGAANSYFYVEPQNTLTNITVKEGATSILPDANGFFRLNTLAQSSNRNFTITADLAKCSLDSMKVNYGYSCGNSYPNFFIASSCQQQTWLKALGFSTGLDVTFDKVTTGNEELCSPFELETIINSTLIGNLEEETMKVVLPPNMSYVPNTVKSVFPVGGTYTSSTYNPTIVSSVFGDTLIFKINNLTNLVGLTGVADLTKNQVKIKFQVTTVCGYISGSSIKMLVSGKSVCGDATPTVIKTTSAINLAGAVSTTQYSLKITTPSVIKTCETAQKITIVVINAGTTMSSVNDYFTIDISDKLNYVAGSITSIRNGPTSNPTQEGSTLTWQMPSTIAPNDSMKLTFDLNASLGNCGSVLINAFTSQSIILNCGITPCITPITTGQIVSNNITTTCCGTLCIKPNAGDDKQICLPKNTVKLGSAPTGFTWKSIPSNPSIISVNSLSGQVTGLSSIGSYLFVLSRNDNEDCSDTVNVTLNSMTPPSIICADGSNSYTLKTEDNLTNIKWFTIDGQQVGIGSTLTITGLFIGLSDGYESYYYTAEKVSSLGCEVELCCPVNFMVQSCCPIPNCKSVTVIKK